MVRKKSEFKVTYTTMKADDAEKFHRAFDEGLAEVQNRFGTSFPNLIGEEERTSEDKAEDRSPTDTRHLLGSFSKASREDIADAITAAKGSFRTWSTMDWRKRIETLRAAAELISERKYLLSAIMSHEAGKSRLESMGDTEESADLIRYYCQQIEDADGFVKPMGRLSPDENVHSVLRPYGVWGVVSPFNFPLALAAGMSAGALVAGNTIVYKPAHDTPWTGYELIRAYLDAGVPPGVVNFINGRGSVVGKELISNPDVDGLIFTGSKEVGMSIIRRFSKEYPKPCITEMGGKNPAIIAASANLEKAAEGVMRSSFGLGGQKCSACSRVYVHQDVKKPFMDLLIRKTEAIRIGDPTQRDVFLGPLINEAAVMNFQTYMNTARRDGSVVTGGNLVTDDPFSHGYFVQPTIVTELPKNHELFYEELFVPILVVAPVESIEEAIVLSNKAEYGLTAGIFSQDENEIEFFFDHIESGCCYANRRGGATTGAWPGVQPFCGWKGSGSSGKGCCGPYYVQQFMREQSRTIMTG